MVKIVKFATDVTGRVENVIELGRSLQDMAAGNLAARIATTFIPSIEPLRIGFNETATRLQDTMVSVRDNAQAITGGGNQISAAADDLAKRTERQAASVEETAAALEQITQTMNDASKRAHEAGRLVSDTKADAERSGQVVGEAVAAMGPLSGPRARYRISSASSTTSPSRQTCLLSMPASRRRGRGRPDVALPWWRRRSANWLSARLRPRARSRR